MNYLENVEIKEKLLKLHNDILKPIKEKTCLDLVISGGAIRDIILGSDKTEDIDIYASADNNYIVSKFFVDNDKRNSYQTNYIRNSEENLIYQHLGIHARKQYLFKDYKIDLMFFNFRCPIIPKNVANIHNFGISQCAYSNENGLYTSQSFDNDIKDKQITFIDNRINAFDEISLKYFRKLWSKYKYSLRIKQYKRGIKCY